MADANDMDLLREFAGQNSEPAFAELVRRHLNLVYSVALRFTGNTGDAQDVAQAVFIILARKAAGLSARTVLTGWLYETTRFTAIRLLRTHARRQAHEQEAFMQSILEKSADDNLWRQLAPHLEAAMSRLAERDRTLLALRFYENKSGAEAAALLGIREETARKRTNRALEKLRKFFTKRGVSSTTAIIAGVISANSVQAAPVALAKSVTALAIVKGSVATASTLTLVKGTIKLMTHAKLKLAIGITAGILLVGGAVTVAISQTSSDNQLSPQEIAKQALDTYATLSSYSDSVPAETDVGGKKLTTTFNTHLQRPNLYRVEAPFKPKSPWIAWSEGNGDWVLGGYLTNAQPLRMNSMGQAFSMIRGASGTPIPAIFFNQNFDNFLRHPALGLTQLKKERDEKVGGVDCYVFSSTHDQSKSPDRGQDPSALYTTVITFWIGKQDHLIHQTRQTIDGTSLSAMWQQMSDVDIKALLENLNLPATPAAIAARRAMFKQVEGSKSIYTETHENIIVNQKYSPSDFSR